MPLPSRPSPLSRRTRILNFVVRVGNVYLGILVLLMMLENALVFHPYRDTDAWQPPPPGQSVEDVWLTTADGTKIHAWWYPCPGSTGALLYCHGNAGNLSFRGWPALELRDSLRESVLLFDYPGFGKCDGSPNEASCYAAADAAYDWLVAQQKIPGERIILYGKSLGGGVATDLAVRRPHRALVLVKTFTSIPDMAQRQFPFLPVRWLVRNRFDTLAKIGACRRPIAIVYADRDGLIPNWMADALFQAAPTPKRLFVLSGAEHNEALPASFLAELRGFLDETAPVGAVSQR